MTRSRTHREPVVASPGTARRRTGGAWSAKEPEQRRRGGWRLVGAILALLVVAGGISALSLSGSSAHHAGKAAASPTELARRDARAFLARYVDANGRVVRRDQGGDTVSEGEGYALLLADALGDKSEFARVWRWDEANLQLPDGLFAYHWEKGRIASSTPATDADLDTAWALVLAGSRFSSSTYTAEGRRVATSILTNETVSPAGKLELVAGTWARGDPATVDPSYLAPEAMAALAKATGTARWRELEANSTSLVAAVVGASPERLPPDWALLSATGAISPAGTSSVKTPTYGLDAQRVPVWYAADCSGAGRHVAAEEWPAISALASGGGRISYTLAGRPRSSDLNPLGYVAAAAAADAAGHRTKATTLLARADRQNRSYHTYYGGAWVALGRVLLDTSWLSSCAAS